MSTAVAPPGPGPELPSAPPRPTPCDPGGRDRVPVLLPLVPTLAGLGLWWHGVHQVDPSRMSHLGLVSVLPVSVLVAPVLVTLGFFLALGQRQLRPPLVAFHVVALVVVLYGTAALVEPVPDYKILYRHAGIIDYIARHGSVDGRIDAYFNWPGFFAFAAFVLEVAGIKTALTLGRLAPFFFELLYLGPLAMLMAVATPQRRLRWLAIWFFYLANWIGQDYLAPQALAYFTYLAILAVVVRWFCLSQFRRKWAPRLRPRDGSGRRPALLAVVIACFVALVPSHQLTPFAVLAAIAFLVVFRQCRSRSLIVLMGVALGAWIAVMTTAYLAGHSDVLTGHIGNLGQTVATNVSERLQGAPRHRLVVTTRLAVSAVIWAAAALGFVLRRRRGHRDHVFALLAMATFPLIALQPYGGEIVQRVYLFSLPFMIFFAVSLFPLKRPGGVLTHWPGLTAGGVVAAVMAVTLFVTRYGNQQVSHFTADEVATVEAMYRLAPPGAFLLGGSDNVPWRATHYADYTYDWVRRPARGPVTADVVARNVVQVLEQHRGGKGAFLILTRSQRVDVETFGALPPGALDRVEAQVRSHAGVRLVYSNADARIYALTG
jgi:hypothetical protein